MTIKVHTTDNFFQIFKILKNILDDWVTKAGVEKVPGLSHMLPISSNFGPTLTSQQWKLRFCHRIEFVADRMMRKFIFQLMTSLSIFIILVWVVLTLNFRWDISHRKFNVKTTHINKIYLYITQVRYSLYSPQPTNSARSTSSNVWVWLKRES